MVKLFTPDAGATWLLTEIDPDDHDHAFGLCDLSLGVPEIGWVSLGELATVRGGLGLPMFDAVVFHGRPLPAPRTSIDGDGGPPTHTQLCVLDEAGLRTPSIRPAGHAPLHAVPASAAPQRT